MSQTFKAALAKEAQLVLHPSTLVFVLLGALVLVPNWPYGLVAFYVCLCSFFNGMNARETHDLDYALGQLPVSRGQMVAARVAVSAGVQVATLALMAALAPLRGPLGIADLYVGFAPNAALVGLSFAMLGLFNLVFFPLYYRNPRKVGVPFLIACAVATLFMVAFEALPYALPWVAQNLATPGLTPIGPKLAVLVAGVVVFAALTCLGARRASRRFERVDW